MIIWNLTKDIPILFRADALGLLFFILTVTMWVMDLVFSIEYMKHEKHKKRYYLFYALTLVSMAGACLAGNLITIYLCYEFMSILSLPLVLHEQTDEALAAGRKYIFYSIGGAFTGLAGFFFIYVYGDTLDFTPGGVLNMSMLAGHETAMLIVTMLVIIGFGSKAGMFPLHAWLPTAHPVAPSPASAFLSGNITKMGVLMIIRFVYYLVGPDLIRGTWVQYSFIGLTLLTILMGSMMAYKEPLMKKRLAYSTVSQVSYALFGIALLNPVGLIGGLMHVVFHSLVKNTLFQTAGAVIHMTGFKKVSEYKDIARKMPVTMWCFTLVSLTLVGVPPTSAFLSKWYLAEASLGSGLAVTSWLGPLVLIISALLTAAYLLGITLKAFFPGDEYDYPCLNKKEPNLWMLVPMLIMTVLAVLFGIWPGGIMDIITGIAGSVL
ncbi:MAG: proton-conducting membrane transporter [Lachnospiraceae bacterium]|nr:proton-conducting membrane transporter [Lachnospiraceae bacterium]